MKTTICENNNNNIENIASKPRNKCNFLHRKKCAIKLSNTGQHVQSQKMQQRIANKWYKFIGSKRVRVQNFGPSTYKYCNKLCCPGGKKNQSWINPNWKQIIHSSRPYGSTTWFKNIVLYKKRKIEIWRKDSNFERNVSWKPWNESHFAFFQKSNGHKLSFWKNFETISNFVILFSLHFRLFRFFSRAPSNKKKSFGKMKKTFFEKKKHEISSKKKIEFFAMAPCRFRGLPQRIGRDVRRWRNNNHLGWKLEKKSSTWTSFHKIPCFLIKKIKRLTFFIFFQNCIHFLMLRIWEKSKNHKTKKMQFLQKSKSEKRDSASKLAKIRPPCLIFSLFVIFFRK